MPFKSILFRSEIEREIKEEVNAPDFFVDLNLDQVVDAITARKQEYNLKPFFYSPIQEVETVYHRQQIVRDLETGELMQTINAFAEKIAAVRRYLNMVSKLDYKFHQEGWHLEAAVVYCEALTNLAEELSQSELNSPGFLEFREFLSHYVQSTGFLSLMSKANSLKDKLVSVRYSLIIKDLSVKVRKYQGEIDYSQEVEKTFEKFAHGTVQSYRIDLITSSGMNHVEAQIVDCVAKLFPEVFSELDRFHEEFKDFLDETIKTFDREIQFYVSYLDFIADIKRMGLPFCCPQITTQKNEICVLDAFDLALANMRKNEKTTIVRNNFHLQDPERIIIVSGPNQGGKTTFARMFGQLHYLASLGLPVPGREANLFLPDRIFTHFEKEEDIRNLRGKLKDDLVRIQSILSQATPDSIIIMNEIFTSTTLKDAIFLSQQIMDRIIQLDSMSVCVSFIDELSTLSEKTISMVSTVAPENPAIRTYKIVRKPADGLSYAIHIAEKHGLSYDLIKERIAR